MYKSWKGVPPNWPAQIVVQPPPPPPLIHPLNGFDACTAPTLATMRVWRRQYTAVGVYIGGANSACAYGNLSAAWFRSAAAMGWGMLPTYVGPQAPCWGYQGTVINPGKAAAEGQAAGANAVADARLFGLAPGSPVYYDMEAYDGGQSCTNAVLTFLGAWDRTVAAKGYLTGVYSSQDSGIDDMQAAAVGRARRGSPGRTRSGSRSGTGRPRSTTAPWTGRSGTGRSSTRATSTGPSAASPSASTGTWSPDRWHADQCGGAAAAELRADRVNRFARSAVGS